MKICWKIGHFIPCVPKIKNLTRKKFCPPFCMKTFRCGPAWSTIKKKKNWLACDRLIENWWKLGRVWSAGLTSDERMKNGSWLEIFPLSVRSSSVFVWSWWSRPSNFLVRFQFSCKLLGVGRWCFFGVLPGCMKTPNEFSSVFAGNFRRSSSRCRMAKFPQNLVAPLIRRFAISTRSKLHSKTCSKKKTAHSPQKFTKISLSFFYFLPRRFLNFLSFFFLLLFLARFDFQIFFLLTLVTSNCRSI